MSRLFNGRFIYDSCFYSVKAKTVKVGDVWFSGIYSHTIHVKNVTFR